MSTQKSPAKTEKTGWDALSPRQRKAIPLLVEDRLTDEQIAAECGVTRDALKKWKRNANFDMAYHAVLADFSTGALKRKMTQLFRRLDALNRQAERMNQVFEERAGSPDMANIPGGTTGLVVRSFRTITRPDGTQTSVPVYEVDTGLMKEYRATIDQIRDEMGQKKEKIEHSGTISMPELKALLDRPVEVTYLDHHDQPEG